MLEKFNDMSAKDKVTVVCGFIVFLVMVFVLSTGFEGDIPKPVFSVNMDELNSILDDLGNNYTINIKDTTGDKTVNYIYYFDGKLKLYESDNDQYGYLEYNGKRYQMNGVTKELVEYEESVGFIDNPLYDYDLIKNFTDSCNYEYVSDNNASCKITLNEYLKYHNNKYNTSYVGSDSDFITLNIIYGKRVNSIKIDYTAYNKVVNYGEDNVNIEFSISYDSNNFDTIYDNYKDVLGE